MKKKIKKINPLNYITIAIGILLIFIDLLAFIGSRLFGPVLVIAVSIMFLPFWMQFFANRKTQREIEAMFPDFVNDLVNSVKSGLPISQSILQVAKRDYGGLSPHVKKLARQLEWAVPLHRALTYFSDDTNSPLIKRTIYTVIEAEKSGGNIEDVLRGVTTSLIELKEISERRRATIHSQILQSYIIFGIFLIVLIFIKNSLVPYLGRVQGGVFGVLGGEVQTISALTQHVTISYDSIGGFFSSIGSYFIHMEGIFTFLAAIQGLFAGLVLGKLSEGNISAGVKHSLILVLTALIIMTLF